MMFDRIRYIGRLARLNRVLEKASDALMAGDIAAAKPSLIEGWRIIQSIKLPRTALINAITGWGLMSIRLDELGATKMAEECRWASSQLQARFDACEYYPDPE